MKRVLKISTLSLLFILSAGSLKAQNSPGKVRSSQTFSGSGDCSTAKTVGLSRSLEWTNPAPNGCGLKQEISSKENGKFVFKEEHNVNWYRFKTKYEGAIAMDIVPVDSTNDYDFVLFKGDSATFCTDLSTKKLSPIRANLARSDNTLAGRTGLSDQAKSPLVGEGPGSSYSESLKVHPQEWYYLAIDNVYPDGKGYTLYLNYLKTVTISGTIKGSDSSLLKSTYTLTDQFGATVLSSETRTGKFEITVPLKENQHYDLGTESEGHFFDSKIITTASIKPNQTKIAINSVLPQLKGGKKYAISTINFLPNSPELYPASLPALKSLCKILRKNAAMQIEIGGHVNGCDASPAVEIQKLSEQRAKTVLDYCLAHGIKADRLTAVGYGCKDMLYLNAKTEFEQRMNRRVEINVLKL